MNNKLMMVTAVSAALMMGACSKNGSNEEGIEVGVKALALSSTAADAAKNDAESVTFRRSDGMKVELLLGMINLVPVELQLCETSLAMMLKRLMAPLSPIGAAYAHGGSHGEGPEGAVDVLASEPTDLGTLTAEPGRYCGIVVELQPGAAEAAKHGAPLDESMTGVGVNVAPCYYASTVGLSDEEAAVVQDHHCIQVRTLVEPLRVTVPLVEPVTLDAANTELQITVAAWYETWFDGVDFDLLETDAEQQTLLADNVAGSLQVLAEDVE
ncbi:MAG: hypothetical protein M3O62_12720 [Pseudomonadota bacterium]|nr:hypothetical protein [Pseudomonadota bacterium]